MAKNKNKIKMIMKKDLVIIYSSNFNIDNGLIYKQDMAVRIDKINSFIFAKGNDQFVLVKIDGYEKLPYSLYVERCDYEKIMKERCI